MDIKWNEIIDSFIKEPVSFRCKNCGSLLAKEKIVIGIVEIKCRRCKTMNRLVYNDAESFISIIREVNNLTKK